MHRTDVTDIDAIVDRLVAHPEQIDEIKKKLRDTLYPRGSSKRANVTLPRYRMDDDDEDFFDNVPV